MVVNQQPFWKFLKNQKRIFTEVGPGLSSHKCQRRPQHSIAFSRKKHLLIFIEVNLMLKLSAYLAFEWSEDIRILSKMLCFFLSHHSHLIFSATYFFVKCMTTDDATAMFWEEFWLESVIKWLFAQCTAYLHFTYSDVSSFYSLISCKIYQFWRVWLNLMTQRNIVVCMTFWVWLTESLNNFLVLLWWRTMRYYAMFCVG